MRMIFIITKIFIAASLFAIACNAQASSLVGVTYEGSGAQFIRLAPDTGIDAPVGPLTTSYAGGFLGDGSSVDPITGSFFLQGFDPNSSKRLYTWDIQTGTLLSSPIISSPVFDIKWDRASGTVVAITAAASGNREWTHVDPLTGSVTPVGSGLPTIGALAGGVSSIDPIVGTVFLMGKETGDDGGLNRLFSIDTETGVLLASPAFSDQTVGAIEWDEGSNTLFGLISGTNGIELSSIDPITGLVTSTGVALPEIASFGQGDTVLDPSAGVFYVWGSEPGDTGLDRHFFSIDLQTGELISSTQVTPFISALEFVPIPSALWLFGSGLLGLIGISRRKKTA